MKNDKIKNILIIVGVIAFCALFVGAMLMYDKLSGDFSQKAPEKDGADTQVVLADDFRVYDSDGNAVRLSDKIGKPVVVNFWATWCGPCRSEMPVFDAAYKEYGDEVEFMMVNLTDGYNDIPEKVAEFVDANGYSFPIYHDLEQNAARVYSVYSIPMTLFVNADGSIYDTVIGAMNEKSFMVRLEAIMK